VAESWLEVFANLNFASDFNGIVTPVRCEPPLRKPGVIGIKVNELHRRRDVVSVSVAEPGPARPWPTHEALLLLSAYPASGRPGSQCRRPE
jgi:hypothetical protein